MSAEDKKEEFDPSTLSDQDRKFYEQFGRLPPKDRKAPARMNQGKRQYFDSGEYYKNKETKGTAVGGQGAAPPGGNVKRGNPLLNKAANNKPGVRIHVKNAGEVEGPAAGDGTDDGAEGGEATTTTDAQ